MEDSSDKINDTEKSVPKTVKAKAKLIRKKKIMIFNKEEK